jgi:hypothetical protein
MTTLPMISRPFDLAALPAETAPRVAELLRELANLLEGAKGGLPAGAALPQYVTLDTAAALVNRSKRSLEKYLYDPSKVRRYAMPAPAVDGGGGRPSEWDWSVLRPWLERIFHRDLPTLLPSHRRPL